MLILMYPMYPGANTALLLCLVYTVFLSYCKIGGDVRPETRRQPSWISNCSQRSHFRLTV